MSDFTPAQSGFSRVFLIEGRARPDHEPDFQSCMKAGAPDQSFGDVERIECPDPTRPGQFVEKGSIQGAIGRPTMDLMGRYALDLRSELLRLARKRCELDVQVHMGQCKDLSDFNQFTKALILEGARITNWSADEVGALSSDEAAAINETGPISAADMYEVVQLSFAARAGDIVTNEVVDVVICDAESCGDCDTESTGCQHVYAITVAAGGSPSTSADVVFSIDAGVTWYADDIDSLGAAEDASAIGCLGTYLVVVSNASNSLHYVLKAEVDDVDYDETWTEVTTGFVQPPNDCWKAPTGKTLFVVGDLGYIYKCTNPTNGVTVLDAGAATSANLNAVHSSSDLMVVAVGDSGAVVYAEDGASFQATTTNPVGVGTNLNCVWVKSDNEWFVGDSAGVLWWTNDQGANWTQLSDFGAAVYDISFSTNSVGYVASATATPRGQIRRTYDGGYSWVVMPEGVGVLPLSDRVNALATCSYDANYVVGVGLGDDASDGFVVVGAA